MINENTVLLHGVAIADRQGVVVEALEVHRDAEGRADLVLASIATSDAARVALVAHPLALQEVEDVARLGDQLLVP